MARLGESMGGRNKAHVQPKTDYRIYGHDHDEPYDRSDVKTLKRLWSEGWTVAEIADALGRTKAGVRSKIFRLRRDGLW